MSVAHTTKFISAGAVMILVAAVLEGYVWICIINTYVQNKSKLFKTAYPHENTGELKKCQIESVITRWAYEEVLHLEMFVINHE